MDFKQRSQKYKARKASNKKVFIIDNPMMTAFCSYVLSQNATIHKYGLTSMSNLMNMINEDYFDKNQVLVLKYRFITKALKLRLNGITNRDLILSDINRTLEIDELVNDKTFLRELSNDEVNFVENTVASFLNNLYISEKIVDFIDMCTEYQQADYRKKDEVLNKIRNSMSVAMTQFRKNDISRDSSDTLFRLSDMESSVIDIHKYVTGPSFKLITGMQGLNAMFGGGLERGNVYAFFGLPGEGKTVTLENLLYQIWKYNKDYQTKDKTKKPCIVLLTMENFVRQTVCALYHILTRGKNLKDCTTAQEAINEFKKHSFEFSGDNPIEIVIKYKPINSVDTNYMYKIVEDLEDEGFETIAFLQDYIKRILPVDRTKDAFQDLGTIVNEFKTFATLKDLPVITASQLNREAAKMIDEGRSSNKNDLIKKLGRANIGESIQIDQNLDGTFIITPEFDQNGRKYMGIKMTKHRYEVFTNKTSIYQPFYDGAQIALVEDLYEAAPAYRESLIRDAEEIRQSFGDIERISINRTVKALEGLNSNTGMLLRPTIKRETSMPIPTNSLVDTSIQNKVSNPRVVVAFIPKEEREKMREKYGIKKMV